MLVFAHYSHKQNTNSLGTLLNIYTYLPQTLFPIPRLSDLSQENRLAHPARPFFFFHTFAIIESYRLKGTHKMTIDQQLLCYKRLPNWTATSQTEIMSQKYITRVGSCAKLTVLSGSLRFYELDEQGQVTAEHLFKHETELTFVEPHARHFFFFQKQEMKSKI